MTPATVLAPAYNEEAVIGRFLEETLPWLPPGSELLVVDDGSQDATASIVDAWSEADPRVRLVTHPTNRGLGQALRTGFAASQGEILVTVDADLSHPPQLIPEVVEVCEGVDAVFASRFLRGGGMEGVPFLRRFISRAGNSALCKVLRTQLTDLTTGFRAYRRGILSDLQLQATGFEIQLEIALRLIESNARIAEVPLQLSNRVAGESKMSYVKLVSPYLQLVASHRARQGRQLEKVP